MSEKHDVVFVVLDSARKDRVSAFGHDRETTPAFDEIASEATVYENAFVPAPWTLPSHCSMFTGRLPSEHGITNGFTDRRLELPSEYPTIAEQLSGRGYATAGFSNNPWVGQLSGLNRGFDRFVEWDLEISRDGEVTSSRALDDVYSALHSALGRAAGQPHVLLKRRFFTSNLIERANEWLAATEERPSFTFMNLMEAHSPYYPPGDAFRELGLDAPGLVEPRALNARLLAYVLGRADLSPDRRNRVMEYYDASLRYQDGKLDELLTQLRSRDLYDDALIVICADHGKTLGEYDRDATPPHYIRDINVNVPLLIKRPNQQRGQRVEDPVELTDLFETIVDIERPAELPQREEGALVEDHVPHTGRDATDVVRWRVLADASQKYVRSEDDEEYFFDRTAGEQQVDARSAALDRYRERLGERVDLLDAPSGPMSEDSGDEELGKAVEGQLQDLGYLS